MLRRLLPTLLALGGGFLALCWGLVSLQRLFAQEREEAYTQLLSRRAALEQLAAESLRQSLERRLQALTPTLYRALEDPLAPAEGLYFRYRGYQLLPRLERSAAGSRTPARRLYESLQYALQAPFPADPWEEYLSRLRSAEQALSAQDSARATALVEELLRHHAANPLPPEQDLPYLLLVAERLQRGPATLPLLRALVRQGLPEDLGGVAHGAGLQRTLLRERTELTEPDFDFLRQRIALLSQAVGEPTEDFLARVREANAGALVLPESLSEPTLLGQRWYLEPRGEAVVGVAVEPAELLEEIAAHLRHRRLIDSTTRLRLPPSTTLEPLSSLRVEVEMPRWAAAQADMDRRYGLKSLLVAACGALAVAILVLAMVSQHRKYRFIELKSDFVSTVSHELRTPLATIRLLAETLERKLTQAPEVRDYPARIVQATDGLHFLVENILSFNRIDKGRWKPRPELVRLEELVAHLRADLVGTTRVPMSLSADVGEAELEVDPGLARLLFINLGRNACAYNLRSPVELSVRAYPRHGHGCLVLFSDNGVGIPQAEWENVFRDFYRLSSQGVEVHGSGLGLALCRRIMRLHGGSIHVDNSSPQGTTFALLFPEPRR